MQTTGPNGDTIVIQHTESADSDFGLQLDDSDEERQVRNPALQNDGMEEESESASSSCSSESDYYSEEQEEEERRFFVFGAVTGAAETAAAAVSPERRGRNNSVGTDGAPKSPYPADLPHSEHRKHRHRRRQEESEAMKPSTAPNIYETLEARRARLRYQAVGGTAATEAARQKALGLSRPGDSQADRSLLDQSPGASTANTIEGAATPGSRKGKPNAESLSDYGFKSTEFSVFGDLLRS